MKTFVYILLSSFIYFSCAIEKPEKEISTEGKFDSIYYHLHQTIDSNLITWDHYVDSFPSSDSLTIFANIIIPKDHKEMILLCHQANSSRGEYIETAKILAQYGYGSVAIDQRNGDHINEIINRTAQLAKNKKLNANYLDALIDIQSGIDFTFKLNNDQPIICLGSSYSASLLLLIAEKNNKIKALSCFSPGEYLKGISLHDSLIGFNKPLFITCAKNEIEQTGNLLDSIPNESHLFFKPNFEGKHGSSALWETSSNNQKYWEKFLLFIETLNL